MKLVNYFIILCSIIYSSASAQVSLENDMTPARTVGVQPMNNDFNLKRGESKEIRIFVSNKMEKKMQFKAYLGDWRRDSVGAHVYSAPGTEPQSCARWITLDKKFLEVDTNTIGVITLRIQIPDSAEAVKEMKWAMLFIETVEEAKAPEETKEMKSQIVPRSRFGVHIYQTPPTITDKEVKLISLMPMSGKNDVFRIIGENSGKVQVVCKSYLELSSFADGKKITVTPIEVPMFPGQKRYFDFTLPPTLAKGKYTMVGVVDAGADMDIQAAQMVVNIQ